MGTLDKATNTSIVGESLPFEARLDNRHLGPKPMSYANFLLNLEEVLPSDQCLVAQLGIPVRTGLETMGESCLSGC